MFFYTGLYDDITKRFLNCGVSKHHYSDYPSTQRVRDTRAILDRSKYVGVRRRDFYKSNGGIWNMRIRCIMRIMLVLKYIKFFMLKDGIDFL